MVKPKVDCLGRNTGKTITVNGNTVVDDRISYLKKGSHATNIPVKIIFKDGSYISYKYDNMGNIVRIYENGIIVIEYEYDKLGRLVRENNKKFNESFAFKYDNSGNMIALGSCPYSCKSTEELERAGEMYYEQLRYDSSNRMTKLGTYEIEFTDDGKCIKHMGTDIAWTGKKMTGYGTHTYSYDASGRRISKDNVTFTYDVNGRLIEQSDGISFIYDHESLIGFKYNGSSYYYRRDILGNIMEIIDSTGASVVKYTYNAWGEAMVSGTNISLGVINPYRYRGYYYDSGIGLYFLQTRYYDPQVGRFLSMDDVEYIDPETIGGVNLYAYCNNNPVMGVDPSGHLPEWAAWLISGAAIVGGIVLTVATAGIGGAIGGALIGAGAGSLINGYVTKANGGDFTAGYISGAISGALCGLGAGLGGAAFVAASEAVNFASMGYLALGVTASFAGGFAGNLAGTVYTSWHNSGFKSADINWGETIGMSAVMGLINIFAGMGAGMSSIAGSMARTVTDLNSKFALKILSGLIAGGTEAAYDISSYFINRLVGAF